MNICRKILQGRTGAAAVIILALFIGNCAYMGMRGRDNVREGITVFQQGKPVTVYNSCVIRGTVKGGDEKRPILVAAYPLSHESRNTDEYVILGKPGPYALYLPEGRYVIYAVADYNNNAVFEKNEVSGVYGSQDGISISSDEVKGGIVIQQKEERSGLPEFPVELGIPDDSSTLTYDSYNGQIVKLYSERFSSHNATAGCWSPTQFMKAFGATIYFTEKYNPGKIPVLFVHGTEGSPQDWAYFLVRLNRAKYQPWFYYYPSGIRLSLTTALLNEDIAELWEKYRFSRLCITAHSMGGLISRSLVTQYSFEKQNNCVRLFVTFATPWSGFQTADVSIKYSSRVLPIWMDIASRSTFIKRTMRSPIPESIGYYMFYGKSDIVSMEKALDDRAFEGAKEKFGFECGHDTILSEKSVFLKFSEILDREL